MPLAINQLQLPVLFHHPLSESIFDLGSGWQKTLSRLHSGFSFLREQGLLPTKKLLVLTNITSAVMIEGNMSLDKTLIIVGGAAIVFLAVAMMLYSQQSSPVEQPSVSYTPPVVTQPTVPPQKVKTVVLSEQNDSGESGTATIRETNRQFVVNLRLTGAPANVAQPAHIHTGSCQTLGTVKHPLTSPLNGQSTTTLNVTFEELMAQLPLAINVHKSTTNAKVYVACGDVSL